MSERMSDGTVFRKFEHQASSEFYRDRAEGPELAEFQDNNIFYSFQMGQKLDKTKIIYIVPYSKDPGQSVYIKKVTVITPNFRREQVVNSIYDLDEVEDNTFSAARGMFSKDIRVMEDLDFKDLPIETKVISVELEVVSGGEDKKLTYELIPKFYSAPIR